MTTLPHPADARAIVVGLEDYTTLGEGFNLPGAASDALRVAAWLRRIGLPKDQIDIRLAPVAEFDVQAALTAENLDDCRYEQFSRDNFDFWLTNTLQDIAGSLLFIYWSGHGLVNHRDDRLHLLLPNASPQQLRSFDATNLLQVMQGKKHAHFGHQIIIVDSCRSWLSEWSTADEPSVLRLNPAAPDAMRRVQQFVMFACAVGEVAGLKQDEGSLFTAALLKEFEESTPGTWPNFEVAFGQASERVRRDTGGAQSPVLWKGQDWEGNRITGGGFMGPGLAEIMSGLGWTTRNFLQHFGKSIHSPGVIRPAAPDLDAMLTYLAELPAYHGAPPLVEFVERVARESKDVRLDQWLKTIPTLNQRAEVADRLAGEAKAPPRVHLILWYHEDAAGAVMQAELVSAEGVLVNTDWAGPPRKALAVTPGTMAAAIGKWVDDALTILGNVELIIELCLPRSLLCSEYDLAKVPENAGQDEAQLGKDYTVLLRCTDRFKGRTKLRTWHEAAPGILRRLGLTLKPLGWASREKANEIVQMFSGPDDQGPVWLASAQPPTSSREDADPIDVAIDNGLPALCWTRKKLSRLEKEDVERKLAQLVQNLSTEFPGKVRAWRQANWGTNAGWVALFWDDPERLPPMVQQMTQGGRRSYE